MIIKRWSKRMKRDIYHVRYEHKGEKYSERAGLSRKAAEARYRQIKAEIVCGKWVNPRERRRLERAARAQQELEEHLRGPAFSKLVDLFTADARTRTRSSYYSDVFQSATRYFRDKPIGTITEADIRAYAAARAKKVGPSTLRKNLTAIGTLFNWAVREKLTKVNPVKGVKKPKEPQHRERSLSLSEYRTLVQGAPDWLVPLFRFAVVTGLRLKELVGLRWEEVDREAGLLHLSSDNKVGRPRVVPLGCVEAEVLAGQEATRFRGGHVFLDGKGELLAMERNRKRISVETTRTMRRLGIRDASFHTLRHTAATWAGKANRLIGVHVPKDLVSELLYGSTVKRTVDRYFHLGADDLRMVVDALDTIEALALSGSSATRQRSKEV